MKIYLISLKYQNSFLSLPYFQLYFTIPSCHLWIYFISFYFYGIAFNYVNIFKVYKLYTLSHLWLNFSTWFIGQFCGFFLKKYYENRNVSMQKYSGTTWSWNLIWEFFCCSSDIYKKNIENKSKHILNSNSRIGYHFLFCSHIKVCTLQISYILFGKAGKKLWFWSS